MADVVQMIEGDYVPVECLEQGAANTLCQRGDGCAMRDVWCEVRDSVKAILRRTTLQSLTERRRTAINFQI
jgi:DNA-binding IscR family transcriptional regulator